MIDDNSEGCNCTCHYKRALLCSQCKVNHPERRATFIDNYKEINADPTFKRENIL